MTWLLTGLALSGELPDWLGERDERGTIPVHRGRLDNGLGVLLAPNDSASVAAAIVFRAGSRWESPASSGVSHFLEHLLFVGTAAWSEDEVKAWIPDRGGTWNGYTDAERVSYVFHLGADDLDDGLHWLEQVAFHPTLPAEKLAKEREVVLQERGGRVGAVMRLFDRLGFGYRLQRDIRRAIFPDSSLALDVIGEDASLDAIDIGLVRDFYERHYGPDNAWLILAGGLDPAEATARIEERFGALAPRGRPPDPPTPRPLEEDVVVAARAMADNDEVALEIGALAGGRTHPDHWVYKLLGKVLTRQLKEELRHERGLVYSVSAGYRGYREVGRFSVVTEADREDVPAIRAAIHAAFEAAAAGGITAGELAHARRAYLGQVALALETNAAQVGWLAKLVHDVPDDAPFPDVRAGVEAVAPGDLARVAAELWRPGNRYEGRRDPILTTASATWAALLVAATLVLVTTAIVRRRDQRS